MSTATTVSDPEAANASPEKNSTNKPVDSALHKGLGYISSTATTISSIGILVDVVIVFGDAMDTGGPAVYLWGFVLTSVMCIIIALCMAEITVSFILHCS